MRLDGWMDGWRWWILFEEGDGEIYERGLFIGLGRCRGRGVLMVMMVSAISWFGGKGGLHTGVESHGRYCCVWIEKGNLAILLMIKNSR